MKPKQPRLGFEQDDPPVLNRQLARDKADRGIALSSAGAPEAWQAMIREAIYRIARRQQLFTSDDLWVDVGERAMYQANPSALGGVFRGVAAEGAIVCTDDRRESQRPATHRRPLRVWRSLICKAA